MKPSKVSKAAGPKPKQPRRARGRAVMVKTHDGTTQTFIFYTCGVCGAQHRVTEYGLRVAACRGGGLVFVVAGGAR